MISRPYKIYFVCKQFPFNVAFVNAFQVSFNYKDDTVGTLIMTSMEKRYEDINETSILSFFKKEKYRSSMKVLTHIHTQI